ncbi:MAG: DUF6268 family outer membrane beta-barrel protein [Methylacidiphilales bacterium]|nr:DUF6268 family outer membrane beta-barrel protein [Candidatus Methylacidiphilales bacterium]MDW8349246.1 DUF6268 family outer membrane beta-barrel protein [Verrucomicrobiae bacterium]
MRSILITVAIGLAFTLGVASAPSAQSNRPFPARQSERTSHSKPGPHSSPKTLADAAEKNPGSRHPFDMIPENEIRLKASYGFSSDLRRGTVSEGRVAGLHLDWGYVATPNVNEDFQYRLGFEVSRSSFSYNQSNTVPNTLEGANFVAGFDWVFYPNWLLRLEARPGIYSTGSDFDSRAFNVPLLLGASYFVDRDLNWIFGLTFNAWRDIPVIPGVGVRWAFARDWQANLVFPTPRLEYRVAPGVRVYAGGEWKGGSYRTEQDFGDTHGDPALNNALLDYREIRAGGGVRVQPNDALAFELETGAMLDRRYHYFRADKQIRSDTAPYVQLGASFRF